MSGRSGFLATANQATTVPPRRSNQLNCGRERSTTRHVSPLAASLAAHKSPVTAAERDELLALLEAMHMPTDPIADLNVQG